MAERESTYTAFSGGADSTALAILIADADPVFTDTGWEFPQLYEHIEKFERVTGRKVRRIKADHPGGLPGYIRDYLFFPNHRARFCTREFKIAPFDKFMAGGGTLNVGLRADEMERVGNHTNVYTVRYPFREWGMVRSDIEDVCRNAGLYPSYPPFMMRGGCVGCFYKRKSEIVAMFHLAPVLYWGLVDLEEEVQDERGKYFHMFSSLDCGLREFALRIQSQLLMFDVDELYAASVLEAAPCGLFCNR